MQRVNRILGDPFFRRCLKRNAAWEEERIFCRHDLQHLLAVARIAYILILEKYDLALVTGSRGAVQPGEAKEMIYAAALLHDMGRWRQYETGEDHAQAGAELAAGVLKRVGFDAAQREIITAAIRAHRGGDVGGGPLGGYLCRADDLSRPCSSCRVRHLCRKINRMETAQLLLY